MTTGFQKTKDSWGFRSTSAGPENYTQSMSAETKYSLDERIKIIPKLGYIGKDSSGLVSWKRSKLKTNALNQLKAECALVRFISISVNTITA